MKIVNTDNYGGDYPDESVVAENITDERFAKVMADALNDRFCDSRYFKVVPDDYKLKPGFEP